MFFLTIRYKYGDWDDSNSTTIPHILPPADYDWVVALKQRIALGGPEPARLNPFNIKRILTVREQREQRALIRSSAYL